MYRKVFENINKNIKRQIDEKCLRNLLMIAFFISIIPLFVIAKYNFPSVDDFGFATSARMLWKGDGSFTNIIQNAVIQAYETYFRWQGCFSVSFLLALNPIFVDEKLYIVVPYVVLTLLIISTFYFNTMIFENIFKASRNQVICVSLVWLFLDIQFLPSAVQGFYWYTGAVAYTVFYSFALFLYGVMIRLAIDEGCLSFAGRCWHCGIMFMLAVVCGGGNYVSAMLTFFVFIFVIAIQIVRKKNYMIYALAFTLFLVAFIFNMLAPGNGIRKGGGGFGTIVIAMWNAFVFSFEKFNEWINIPVIILVAFLIPILGNIIRKTSYKFKYPMIISFSSFVLLFVQFFPHSYALSSVGPDRLLNIIFFSHVFFTIFNVFYWGGWIYQKYINVWHSGGKHEYSVCDILVTCILLLCCVLALKKDFPSTSVAAVHSLVIGESKNYYEENKERLSLLSDDSQENVVLKKHKSKPMILFWDDGDENPNNWRNEAMADFYGKDSIVVKDE